MVGRYTNNGAMADARAIFLKHRDLLTAGLLGFSSGYVTSNTKTRFGTYGGMMTGNTVGLGMSMQQNDWGKVAVFASVLSGFAFGTLLALIMLKKAVKYQKVWLVQ